MFIGGICIQITKNSIICTLDTLDNIFDDIIGIYFKTGKYLKSNGTNMLNIGALDLQSL